MNEKALEAATKAIQLKLYGDQPDLATIRAACRGAAAAAIAAHTEWLAKQGLVIVPREEMCVVHDRNFRRTREG